MRLSTTAGSRHLLCTSVPLLTDNVSPNEIAADRANIEKYTFQRANSQRRFHSTATPHAAVRLAARHIQYPNERRPRLDEDGTLRGLSSLPVHRSSREPYRSQERPISGTKSSSFCWHWANLFQPPRAILYIMNNVFAPDCSTTILTATWTSQCRTA